MKDSENLRNSLQRGLGPGFVDHVRELTNLSKMNLPQRAMKLAEEVGEVNEAVLVYYGVPGTEHKPEKKVDDVAEETLDVIIVATSILAEMNVSDWTIQNLLDKKMARWEGRLRDFNKEEQ